MKASLLAIVLTLAPALMGQGGSPAFSAPSVLTNGVGTVGQRSGEDVELRYFGSVSGIYDSGLIPLQLTPSGLLKPDPLVGVEVGYGAYGRHRFRRSFIGVDYIGSYRHYTNNSNYGGSNQQLSVEYATQAGRRLLLDTRVDAGTQIYGTAFGPSYPGSGNPVDSNSLLFDNRTTYLQGGLNASYLVSNRTSVTMGGSGSMVRREAPGLPDANGYILDGSIQHQLSRDTFISGNYSHTFYDYPQVFSNSTTNSYMLSISHKFGRTWSVSAGGGAFTSSVVSVQLIPLPPELAEILGIPVVPVVTNSDNVFPMVQLSVAKQFRKSNFSASASQRVSPGNGLYLTSRQDNIGAGYSYTGFQHFSLSATVNWNEMHALAQAQLKPYQQFNSAANLSYNLGHGINLSATYNYRHQDVNTGSYLTNSSRVQFGIYFSPSSIPISFH